MAQPLKILVCGDIGGKWEQLYKRISSVQKKAGAFDMLFCVGDSFGQNVAEWKQYVDLELTAPIDTYILGPNMPSQVEFYEDLNGCELCPNITYLGRRGVYTTGTGLSIAYLSGMEGPTSDTTFTQKDIEDLRQPRMNDNSFLGVDILLTSQWPRGVEKYGLPVNGGVKSAETGSELISQLALALKPRYHFAAQEGEYYERLPYRNHKVLRESSKQVTRFIGMARVGNAQKRKFLYAFNVKPLKHISLKELISQPEDVTECPFIVDDSAHAKQIQNEDRGNQFFYDPKAMDGPVNKRHHGGGGGPREKHPNQAMGPCWFCLGSPEVEKQLVVSIGEHCYVALAKGGLVPDHVLILPIGHHQSTVSAPEEVVKEIDKFKSALRKCYKSQKKVVVFFERNYKSSHLQIQVVPLPGAVAHGVPRAFEDSAKQHELDLQEIPKLTDLKQVLQPGCPYFYAEVPNGDKLLTRVNKGFPLQFGREVLSDKALLDMPHRVDWRACSQSKEQDIEDAQEMRKMFKPFDFNDDEEEDE